MKPVLAKERAFYCKKNIELLRYQFNLIIIFLYFLKPIEGLFHQLSGLKPAPIECYLKLNFTVNIN